MLTPAELSAKAIENIENDPSSWNQEYWHWNCGTTDCWAGHIDLLIGGVNLSKTELTNDVFAIMKLSPEQWTDITDWENSLARLKAFHKKFFVDGIFGTDGFDNDGYNEHGYDREGFDREGHDEAYYAM